MSIQLVLGLAFVAPDPSVHWSAPPGCPNRAQVLGQVGALIRDPSGEDRLEQATVHGVIDVDDVGFVLRMDIETSTGTTRKSVQADDCTVLARVAALMIAVAVDPVQTSRNVSPPEAPSTSDGIAGRESGPIPEFELAAEPEPDPRPLHTGPPEQAAATVDPDREHAPVELGGFVRASGSLGRGLLPRIDGGLGLGVGLLAPHLRVEVIGSHVFAQEAHYPPPSPGGARIAAWGGSLRAGPRAEVGPLELHALGTVDLTLLTARGLDVRNPRRAADLHVAVSLVPGLRWAPHPRVALGADLEVQAPLRRPAFTVGARSELYRSPAYGVRAALVVEMRWGATVG